jgi:hypothetical protein
MKGTGGPKISLSPGPGLIGSIGGPRKHTFATRGAVRGGGDLEQAKECGRVYLEACYHMPRLDWIGMKAVVNHHRELPCQLLICDNLSRSAMSLGF